MTASSDAVAQDAADASERRWRERSLMRRDAAAAACEGSDDVAVVTHALVQALALAQAQCCEWTTSGYGHEDRTMTPEQTDDAGSGD